MEKKHQKIKANKRNFIIAAVIILLFLVLYSFSRQGVAATVNGEKIYEKRVDALYNSLPIENKLTKDEILTRIINTKLIVSYIEKSGAGLSEEDFNKELQKRLTESNMTLESLETQLSLRGATLEDVKETINIENFISTVLLPQIHITPDQISKFRSKSNSTLSDAELNTVLTEDAQRQVLEQIIDNQRKISTITYS